MRGKPCALSLIFWFSGITPACAGKTNRLATATDQCPGSPPHVRGKQLFSFKGAGKLRITPACAGKTASTRRKTGATRDHPRMCGENPKRYAGILTPFGITPACAGKTCPSSCIRDCRRDHPRMCGENTKKSLSHQRLPIVKIPFFMSLSASAIVAVASDNA